MRSIKQIGTSHPGEPIGDAANHRGMTLETYLAMKKLLLAAITTILLSGAAQAAEVQCTPKDNTARILKSANPNDTAPGWKMAVVGTAATFTVKRTVSAETGKYFQGDLISTRGGTMGRNLFILAQEWDCGS